MSINIIPINTGGGGGGGSPSGPAGGDLTGSNYPNPTVATVGTSTAANIHTAEAAANAATSANTASTIVKRDGSGNFSAGTITSTQNTVGDLTIVSDSITTNTSGNTLSINGTGSNGQVSLIGGAGTANGGSVTLTGGNSTSSNNTSHSGTISLSSGTAVGAHKSTGDINITTAALSSSSGHPGTINITSGNGTNVGSAGLINITGSSMTDSSAIDGGSINLNAGTGGAGGGSGGPITIQTGTSPGGSGEQGGDLSLTTGTGDLRSGYVLFNIGGVQSASVDNTGFVGPLTGSATAVGGITVTGTPSTGQVLTATSTSAADWQTPSGGGGGPVVKDVTGTTQTANIYYGTTVSVAQGASITVTLTGATTVLGVTAISKWDGGQGDLVSLKSISGNTFSLQNEGINGWNVDISWIAIAS